MISIGLEELAANPPAWLKGQRLGLLCNQASTDRNYRHSREVLAWALPGQLTCLFSPQHGFFADRQDNMVESPDAVDEATGLPLFSLYGERRQPDPAMFDHLDVLLVDLQDVGTRVYTFIYTMAYCLETAAKTGKRVVILDRPNPVGGEIVEGNLLDADCRSFVGLYPIPMRHGLTIGELARLFNEHFGLGTELTVIPMRGWQRSMFFRQTGFPWVFPSPNMPTPETALVYPGQVLWEGTNLSEGRGTCLPFELWGAPFVEPARLLKVLDPADLAGCFPRPVAFEPTSNKFRGELCRGFHLQVVEPAAFRPYRTALALLRAVLELYGGHGFAYKEPPYEYEYERLPLDLILGRRELRQVLEAGRPVAELAEGWRAELQEFERLRRQVMLY
jgi:uncharacterized protein YbbC (DUF1343 family)